MLIEEQLINELEELIKNFKKEINIDVIKEFLMNSIKIFLKYYQLEDYILNIEEIKNIQVGNKKITPAAYGNDTLYLQYDSYLELYKNLSRTFLKCNDKEAFLLLILLSINHELNHANQLRIYLSDDSDIEALLIRTFYSIVVNIPDSIYINYTSIRSLYIALLDYLYIRKSNSLYLEYYDYNPIERMADIPSYQLFIKLATKIEREDLIKKGQEKLEQKCRQGYTDILSPSEIYCEKVINKLASYKHSYIYPIHKQVLEEGKKLSLEKRLTLGLPLSNDDIEEGIKKLNRIQD